MKTNCVTILASSAGRDYITPEDVSAAIDAAQEIATDAEALGIAIDEIRLATLEVLGKQTEFGVEDAGLCAFIAWRGDAYGI